MPLARPVAMPGQSAMVSPVMPGMLSHMTFCKDRRSSLELYCRLAGIELWELFRVDNSCCTGMPLGVPEKDAASNPAGQSLVVMQNA